MVETVNLSLGIGETVNLSLGIAETVNLSLGIAETVNLSPVSYTHLDVYKRQILVLVFYTNKSVQTIGIFFLRCLL